MTFFQSFPLFVDLFCLHQPQLEAFEDNEVENYTEMRTRLPLTCQLCLHRIPSPHKMSENKYLSLLNSTGCTYWNFLATNFNFNFFIIELLELLPYSWRSSPTFPGLPSFTTHHRACYHLPLLPKNLLPQTEKIETFWQNANFTKN